MLMLLSGEMLSLCISFRLLMTLWMISGLLCVQPSRPPKTPWMIRRLPGWYLDCSLSDPAGLLRLSGWTPDWGREGSEQTGPDDHLYWWGISPWFSSGGDPGRRYCLCPHIFPRSCWALLCSSRCNSGTCRLQPETPECSDEQSSRLISGRSHTLFWRSQYKLLSTQRPLWH